MRKNLNEKKYACRPCCFNKSAVGFSTLRDTERGITDVAGQPIGSNYQPTQRNTQDQRTPHTLYVPVTVHREQSVKKEYQQDATI